MIKPLYPAFQRIYSLALLIGVGTTSLGCSAQSAPAPSDIDRQVQRHVRANYNVPPQVKIIVGGHRPSTDFPQYEQITVTFSYGDKVDPQEFLLSKDGKTLIRMTKIDMTKDPYAEAMSKIDVTGRPVRGSKDAKVTIVNYDDFQCPFCARMHETLTDDVLKTYGDKVKVIYKDYPLTEIHAWAKHAAVDANCLNQLSQQAYWGFADDIHAAARSISQTKGVPEQFAAVDKVALEQGQKTGVDLPKLQACVTNQKDDAVRASMTEAELMGVSATPTMFINGQKVDGAIPPDELKAIINQALADVGQSAPTAAKPVSPQPSGASQKPALPGLAPGSGS